MEQKTLLPIRTIVLYPRPHADTITAVFLLRQYGKEQYPGIDQAPIEWWKQIPEGKTAGQFLHEGAFLVDMGGGEFDHHGKADCASVLVAKNLGIADRPELKKLLAWVSRDEKEGKGTTSKDTLDRAFGLSGLIMSLHRAHMDNPTKAVEAVLPLLTAHVAQERRRYEEVPQEWQEARESGKANVSKMQHGNRVLTIVAIETTSTDLVGYIRNHRNIRADVVVQILPSRHINIITNQQSGVLLPDVVRVLRIEEARKKQIDASVFSAQALAAPGRIEKIPEWFYDTAANSIQNGGVVPESVAPTQLSGDEVLAALRVGLDQMMLERRCPPQGCRGPACYFFDYDLLRCEQRKIFSKYQS